MRHYRSLRASTFTLGCSRGINKHCRDVDVHCRHDDFASLDMSLSSYIDTYCCDIRAEDGIGAYHSQRIKISHLFHLEKHPARNKIFGNTRGRSPQQRIAHSPLANHYLEAGALSHKRKCQHSSISVPLYMPLSTGVDQAGLSSETDLMWRLVSRITFETGLRESRESTQVRISTSVYHADANPKLANKIDSTPSERQVTANIFLQMPSGH